MLDDPMIGDSLVFAGVVALFLILVIMAGVKTVPQGQMWTVERFGRYLRTMEPGLSLLIPFIDRVGKRMRVMEQVLDVPPRTVITRDNAAVVADGVVFYRISDASRAAYQVQNLEEALINVTMTNLRSVIGSMDLDDTLSKRAEINETLMAVVDEAAEAWGVKIMRIEISDLRMSEELQAAMSLQMTAERKRRASVTEANGQREAAILRAQGLREAEILKAQGLREAAFLEAEARERAAEAEARATQVVSEAISAGDIRAIQFFLGQKYVESLQALGSANNTKLIMMPLEASGVTGAVAGLGELLLSSLADGKSNFSAQGKKSV